MDGMCDGRERVCSNSNSNSGLRSYHTVSDSPAARTMQTLTSATEERRVTLRTVAPLRNAHRAFEGTLHKPAARALNRRALQQICGGVVSTHPDSKQAADTYLDTAEHSA